MKKAEIEVGSLYRAKVSEKVVTVRIDSEHDRKGWWATNLSTGRKIRILGCQRLRRKVG